MATNFETIPLPVDGEHKKEQLEEMANKYLYNEHYENVLSKHDSDIPKYLQIYINWINKYIDLAHENGVTEHELFEMLQYQPAPPSEDWCYINYGHDDVRASFKEDLRWLRERKPETSTQFALRIYSGWIEEYIDAARERGLSDKDIEKMLWNNRPPVSSEDPMFIRYSHDSIDGRIEHDIEFVENEHKSTFTTATPDKWEDEYWGFWQRCDTCGCSNIEGVNYCNSCGKAFIYE